VHKLLLLVVLLPTLVSADEVQTLGSDVSCTVWIIGTNRFGNVASPDVSVELVNYVNQRNWLLGFYSGANVRAPEGAKVAVPDELGFLSLISQMCLTEPEDTLAGAANRAMDFLVINNPAPKKK